MWIYRNIKIYLDRFVMDRPGLSRRISALAAGSGLLTLLFLVTLAWFLWPRYMPWIIGAMSPIKPSGNGIDFTTAGTFGDQFGGINALFTALALVGVIWTAIAQIKDRAIIEKQAFETTFFNMLTLIRQAYGGIRIEGQIDYQGHVEVLEGDASVERLVNTFTDRLRSTGRSISEMSREEINESYIRSIHDSNEALLSVYFRTTYNLLRLIDRSRSLDSSDRILYGNILRAQISSNALYLIGFNAMNADISGDLKTYVEKYRLLRYTPEGRIRETLQQFYKPETFERRRD